MFLAKSFLATMEQENMLIADVYEKDIIRGTFSYFVNDNFVGQAIFERETEIFDCA